MTRNAQVYRAAGKWTREARLVVPCTLTRMRSVRPSVGHHPRYCPAIMHDAQMRRCTGQPGMGRGKHAWSFHARSRACSVRGPGRPRTIRRGLLSFAQLSSCRPESIGRRERKPCGPRSGRKPSGTQAVSSRAVRGLHASRAERGSGGWSRARGLVVTGRTNRPDCRRATPRPMTWRRPDSCRAGARPCTAHQSRHA